MMGAPEKREAISGSLIDKLLNNPHMEIQQEPRRYPLLTETTSQTGVHAGAQQGNPTVFVADSLTAQRPLLDGGEGEFQPNNVSMNIEMHAEQEIPNIREAIQVIHHEIFCLPYPLLWKQALFPASNPPSLTAQVEW